MHMRGWVRILALTLSILCLLGTPALAEHAAQVSEAYIPLYADASLSNWIGVIHQGAYLTVRGEQNGVAAVTYYGQSGYTPASGLSAVSGEAEDAVVAVNTRLYQLPSTTSAYRSLAAGVSVRLLAVNDGCAMVDVDGTIGFTFRSHLRTASDLGSSATTEDNNVVYDTFTATVNVQNAYVYASPSTASASMRVLYGRELTVVAYDDTWARVYNGSFYGYILRSALTTETVATPIPTPTPTPVPTPTPTPSGDSSFEQAVESGNYSNEELTFLYLTQEAGLNTAAACGVLANIKAESSFRPTALSSGGGSYGICQWTGSRRTRLQNYCENRGLDYTTLSAQLQFLEYELENYYPKVMNYLRAVDNTAQGAYDAGYYFCYHFEAPSNRASRSVTRGNSARDTYWPKYA